MRMLLLTMALAAPVVLADEANCSVILTDTGAQKINVIKVLRTCNSLQLRGVMDLVEAPKPVLVCQNLSPADAESVVAALAAAGAKGEVQQKGAHGPAHPRKAEVLPTFDVKLESWGTSKIQVIKIVRDRTGLGLKETKDLVESAPIVVSKGQSKLLAESMVSDLIAVGAKASIAPVR